MMTAIGITLLVGVGLGVVLGVPLGRTLERVRPRASTKSTSALDAHKVKKKSER